MTLLLNGFEGGTSGSSVTTGNSGTGGNPLDVISIPGGGTVGYDSTRAAHGLLSCKLATTTAGNPYVSWTTSMGSQATVWFRAYLYFTANPASAQRVYGALSSGTSCASLTVGTGGKLQFLTAAGTNIFQQNTTIPLNAWFRIEGFITGSASAGQVSLSRYDSMDSTTAAETETSAASFNLTGVTDTYRFGHGIGSGIANLGPWWMDDIGLSSTGPIGPYMPGGIAVGTTPVLLASVPPHANGKLCAHVSITNGSVPIYLGGGSGVSSVNGVLVGAGGSFTASLYPTDQLWGVTTSGTSTVYIWQNGG